MIDWLTLRLPVEKLSPAALDYLRGQCGTLVAVNPTGEPRFRTMTRETVATPFGTLFWQIKAEHLHLEGSPAQMSAPNNVFGERDPRECAQAMWQYFDDQHGAAGLPQVPNLWRCTRMDATLTYPLASGDEVRKAIRCLADTQSGTRHVTVDRGTCYWNIASDYRTGKAYAKGPELQHKVSKRTAAATPEELHMSRALLRLELKLAARFWRRAKQAWHEWSPDELEAEHSKYFKPLLANLHVTPAEELEDRLRSVARTDSQASAAYRTWLEIKNAGIDHVRSRKPASTLRKHRKVLRDAGLTDADINTADRRLPARRTIAIGSPVHSWAELREVFERRIPRARHAISEDDDTGTVGVHRPRVLAFDRSCIAP